MCFLAKLTENVIKEVFSDKTFSNGIDYYSSAKSYVVRASIDEEISTECTCPAGFMCKHGAALLLKSINAPSSFVDTDRFLLLLERKSKLQSVSVTVLLSIF